MSRHLAVAILGLAAASLGAGRAGADERDRGAGGPRDPLAALRLVWCDPLDLGAGAETVARAEASSLLTRLGATVSWRRGAAGQVREPGEIWIVLVGEGPRETSHHVLGATLVRDGPPLVWVRVPNLRESVGVSGRGALLSLPHGELRLVAVAVGRVVAHEVVHVVAPSLPHGRGLMAERFGRRQLTGAALPIESDVVLAFRAALRSDPVLAPGPQAIRAAQSGPADKDR